MDAKISKTNELSNFWEDKEAATCDLFPFKPLLFHHILCIVGIRNFQF